MSAEDTLVFEDALWADGFTQVPNAVLFARRLSRDARMLYAVLLGYAFRKGRCFPGYDRLRADLGCGPSQVSKYMQELRGVDLVRVQRRGQGLPNVYTITTGQRFLAETEGRITDSVIQDPASSTELVRPDVPPRKQKNNQSNNNEGEMTIDGAAVWEQVRERLRPQMSRANYATWLEGTRAVGREGATLVVAVVTKDVARELGGSYARLVARALGEVAPGLAVRYVVA